MKRSELRGKRREGMGMVYRGRGGERRWEGIEARKKPFQISAQSV